MNSVSHNLPQREVFHPWANVTRAAQVDSKRVNEYFRRRTAAFVPEKLTTA